MGRNVAAPFTLKRALANERAAQVAAAPLCMKFSRLTAANEAVLHGRCLATSTFLSERGCTVRSSLGHTTTRSNRQCCCDVV